MHYERWEVINFHCLQSEKKISIETHYWMYNLYQKTFNGHKIKFYLFITYKYTDGK